PGLMPTNSSRTPSAIRSGRVAPVNDFSSARVKLTFLGGPKRDRPLPVRVLRESRCESLREPATGGILTTRYGTLKSAAVRARMRIPGALPTQVRARRTTTTEDAGAHAHHRRSARSRGRGCAGSGPGRDGSGFRP